MLTHAWIIPLIPAISFLLILAIGKKLPRGGSEIGIASVSICFVLALGVASGWIGRVNHPPVTAHGTETPAAEGHGTEPAAEGDHATEPAAEEPAAEGDHATEPAGEEPATEPAAETTTEDHGAAGSTEERLPVASEGAEGGEEAHHSTPPVVREMTWFQSNGVKFPVGTMIDGLSTVMLVVVTLISLLVHVFSTDYVAGDRRYTHYFAFLSLFTASMLFFVLSSSTLQMIVGWELVGLCSFGLIGHWWEEKPNSDAALKAFLTNRVGDIGLLCGMIILYFAAGGTFSVIDINTHGQPGGDPPLPAAGGLAVADHRGDVQVRSVRAPHLAARRHGRTDSGVGAHPRRHHGGSRHLHGGPPLRSVLQRPVHRYRLINALAVVGSVTLLFGALLAFVQRTSRRCWRTPPSASSATW
jgi:NADH-quinone oxidoreductase subunit L